jgi:hypothetical protein
MTAAFFGLGNIAVDFMKYSKIAGTTSISNYIYQHLSVTLYEQQQSLRHLNSPDMCTLNIKRSVSARVVCIFQYICGQDDACVLKHKIVLQSIKESSN